VTTVDSELKRYKSERKEKSVNENEDKVRQKENKRETR
jgi:hypothetical protein